MSNWALSRRSGAIEGRHTSWRKGRQLRGDCRQRRVGQLLHGAQRMIGRNPDSTEKQWNIEDWGSTSPRIGAVPGV